MERTALLITRNNYRLGDMALYEYALQIMVGSYARYISLTRDQCKTFLRKGLVKASGGSRSDSFSFRSFKFCNDAR